MSPEDLALRTRVEQIVDEMQRASDLCDEANGLDDYQPRLVALALIARHFLRKSGIRKLLAALDAPREWPGWQPMETAPTNVSVLVFVPNRDHYGPGIYRAIHVDMGTGRRWMTTGCAIRRDLAPDSQPTHWMPLPPPPDGQEPER